MKNIIEINSLNYKKVFKDFSLSIEKNKFITISGSNKSGKTTLIRILGKQIETSKMIKIENKFLEDYNISDLSKMIQIVIPGDRKKFLNDTLEKELLFIKDYNDNQTSFNELIKKFKLNKYLNKNPNDLDLNIQTKIYLVKALLKEPKILLVDDLNYYLEKKEVQELLKIIKDINKENKITIIYATDNLEEVIESDYLYILSAGNIILEGNPLQVLQKDNMLNKLGLELPFMIDLSVKLRDYDLIQDIELDMDRMVEKLWK